MKKEYVTPQTMLTAVGVPALLTGSGEIRSDKGIGYGGVDEEGEREVDTRRHGSHNVWDDEEEEDNYRYGSGHGF